MEFRVRRLFLIGLALVFLAPPAFSSDVKGQIRDILRRPWMSSAKVAIRAEVLASREEIFSLNARVPMIPASNLKLLTSGCALLDFGPDYRFKTVILGDKIDGAGILHGDLVLRGSGDPTWNKDFYSKSTIPLIALAQKLRERGLRKIEGNLVVDDTLFDRQFVGRGWKSRYQWEEYAAEVGGASLNKNEVDITVIPGSSVGSPGMVVVSPESHAVTIVNHTWTTRSGTNLSYHRDRLHNTVVVTGPIGRYYGGMRFNFNVHNPPALVASAFVQVLKAHSIEVKGEARVISMFEPQKYSRLIPLAEFESPPLLAVIHRLDKESDNFLAEHLFKALGALKYGRGSLANSRRAISTCLSDLGLSPAPLALADGSGLSDQDRVSALTLVRLLEAMSALPIGVQFKNSLPQSGVDGTLEDRLKDVVVQAKTGAIRGVNSLSGYLVDRRGRTIVFSILINDFRGSSETARQDIDAIVRVLANA